MELGRCNASPLDTRRCCDVESTSMTYWRWINVNDVLTLNQRREKSCARWEKLIMNDYVKNRYVYFNYQICHERIIAMIAKAQQNTRTNNTMFLWTNKVLVHYPMKLSTRCNTNIEDYNWHSYVYHRDFNAVIAKECCDRRKHLGDKGHFISTTLAQ